MKVRIGRRRSQLDERSRVARSPESLALGPAFSEGAWDVPHHFNYTRDVVDVLAANPKRRALMFLGSDGVIEPRTFHHLSEAATRWAAVLLERGVTAGDRVLVVAGKTPEWVEAMLACLKIGVSQRPLPGDPLRGRARGPDVERRGRADHSPRGASRAPSRTCPASPKSSTSTSARGGRAIRCRQSPRRTRRRTRSLSSSPRREPSACRWA